MANIAIVAATIYAGDNEECFRAGLASTEARKLELTFVKHQKMGIYNVTELRNLVRSAADNKPDIIVTVEGLVMAQAAALELREDDPKFIFLSADALGWNPIALAGGVNMDTPGGDKARKALLKNTFKTVQDTSIYLVVNN